MESEEEEERKKLRVSDPTGQKRKDVELKENQSRAKAKAADLAGSKRKPSKIAAETPAKAKMADPTWGNEKSR